MQAVGQLAAGLAHDLNTMLGGIVATAELVGGRLPPGGSDAEDLAAIVAQARSAAELIRQLLAFSRQEMLRPARVHIGELVLRLTPLIRAQIGRQLGLGSPSDRGPAVEADPQALERVILNLVTNARDAIGRRPGRIEIGWGVVDAADLPEDARSFIPPGRYAMLSVADDGPGVPAEHAAHIFEPYFTTKPAGAGTGLGLATAYGLVKQSGGFLLLDRRVARGARFIVVLPLAGESGQATNGRLPMPAGPHVLLAEDEAVLRSAMARALEQGGACVTAVADGEAALEAIRRTPEITLLVSDIRMPGLDGLALVERARELAPGLRVVLVSGFADAVERARLAAMDVAFLAKPFSLNDLAQVVAGVDAR
jgi:two-component system cell cycle sensor histidine kinase/response regulator CckA